jgi:hypothetical protein
MPASGEDLALWLTVAYVDGALTRRQILRSSGASDAYYDWYARVSHDNGQTWSTPTLLKDAVCERPDGGMVAYLCGYQFDRTAGRLYEKRMRRLWPGLPVYTFSWKDHEHPFNDHTFIVEDGAKEVLLKYEEGPDFDPENPFDPVFCRTNRAYAGVSMAFGKDGTAYYPIVCHRPGAEASHRKGGVTLMRRDPAIGNWLASTPQFIDPERSSRGLLEPDVALLSNGHLLVVMRGSNTDSAPGRKWFTVSTDGGRALSPVEEFRYDDGSLFYSPSSIHTFIRSGRNGKLYWIANIVDQPPKGNSPRYPLVIAEIDEENMAVCRDSLVEIDRRGEGEPEALQLSNFSVIEDRQTQDIEIYLTRIGEHPDHFWKGAVYRYVFSPPR